ncbi:RNA 2',3'-cyclic phosphodiesterase [Paenibacillus sp. LMG 31456]|uniref:RNA 2',3'-cyclic phosphodiesterase n=1 Tax=Paenibacillus foliorum TaxID=2654974 RepID=A0A972GLD7_9BACL|nr:RNA 2',3'-cyclic phosphodiesterase [Paenibacillus foliorum]NOU92165.1 RNA 2',3'-cyclic phosphodiesterase [Paenibacillus foliorum]
MNKARLFLALPLREEHSAYLEQLMRTLQPKLSFQKWVHKDDLHITLKFLGDTDIHAMPSIQSLMNQVALNISPFQLNLHALGVFGKPLTPSILWVGVGGDLTALNVLQAQTESAMSSLDFTLEDRTYNPHITIARKYLGDGAFSKTALDWANNELKLSPMQWTADKIVLYRTHLGHKPMYEAVDTYPLSQTSAPVSS